MGSAITLSDGGVIGQVDFTNYMAETLQLVPDLVNAGDVDGTDELSSAEGLAAFLSRHEIQPPAAIRESDLVAVRELRAKVRGIFAASSVEHAAAVVNSLIADSGTSPHLTDHDGRWHIHYTSMNAPIADRLAAIIGMCLASILTETGIERLGVCAADDCEDVFIDTSKNRSRRFCGDTCSTRTNVAAYRARKTRRA